MLAYSWQAKLQDRSFNPGTGQLCFNSHSLLSFYARKGNCLIFAEEPCQDEAANRIRCASKHRASLLIPRPELFQVLCSLCTRWQQQPPRSGANQPPGLVSLCHSGLHMMCHFNLFWQNVASRYPALASLLYIKGTASIRPTSTTKILAEINWP